MGLRSLVLRFVRPTGWVELPLEPMVHGREMMPRLPLHGACSLEAHDRAEAVLDAGEVVGQFGVRHLRSGGGECAGSPLKRLHRLRLGFAPVRGAANADANAAS